MATLFREHGAVTVTAYRPLVLTDAWLNREAERLLESVVERFDEDYCASADDHTEIEKAPWERVRWVLVAATREDGADHAGVQPGMVPPYGGVEHDDHRREMGRLAG